MNGSRLQAALDVAATWLLGSLLAWGAVLALETVRHAGDVATVHGEIAYLGRLAETAASAKAAGIPSAAPVRAATDVARVLEELQERRDTLAAVIAEVDAQHEAPEAQAHRLTREGMASMQRVREASDALELLMTDELWPLPKYREMLFPV